MSPIGSRKGLQVFVQGVIIERQVIKKGVKASTKHISIRRNPRGEPNKYVNYGTLQKWQEKA